METVRLTGKQLKGIKEAVKEVYGSSARVFLFGSRTDRSRKGGDVDLLVVVNGGREIYGKRIELLGKLYRVLGERKIDLIITDKPETEVEKKAFAEGVEI
ncbi:MAG: nucleotidyltransferase domain-containing protein [Aquificae bacterium]|nr:nucleotidyltransferase domain-containing protein [Aquificota bacterium]